jgi:hypothetical protein
VHLLAAAALALTSTAVPAAEIEGVTFAERISVAGVPFELARTALLRYRIVFRGYVAALYVAPGAAPESVYATDAPKRLEISYFWGIPGSAFAKASEEGIARNLGPAAVARIRPALDQLHALYVDVRPGDRYALTYVPGRGLELSLNGVPRGAPIEGAEVAAAVFSIWFGPQPFDVGLKRELLGLS